MAIYREVNTAVYCDECGKCILEWNSKDTGVSRVWAAYFARQDGCTTGKKIICKKCRIKKRIEKCSLIKKYGEPGKDGNACMGFGGSDGDEPIEKCKRCIACTSFDWEEERQKKERHWK